MRKILGIFDGGPSHKKTNETQSSQSRRFRNLDRVLSKYSDTASFRQGYQEEKKSLSDISSSVDSYLKRKLTDFHGYAAAQAFSNIDMGKCAADGYHALSMALSQSQENPIKSLEYAKMGTDMLQLAGCFSSLKAAALYDKILESYGDNRKIQMDYRNHLMSTKTESRKKEEKKKPNPFIQGPKNGLKIGLNS